MPEGTIAQPIPPTMIRRFSWRRKLLGVPCAVVVVGGVGVWYGLTTAQHFQQTPMTAITGLGPVYFAKSMPGMGGGEGAGGAGGWKAIEWREGEPARLAVAADGSDLERIIRIDPGEYTQPWPQPWPNCMRHRGIHAPFDEVRIALRSPVEVWPTEGKAMSAAEAEALRPALAAVYEHDPKLFESASIAAAGPKGIRQLEWVRIGWWGVAVGKWIALAAVGLGCVRAVVPKRGEVRRDRAARGLCVWCAYPRGDEDVCAECGRPVTG